MEKANKQIQAKQKLDMIKTISVDEEIELSVNKLEMLSRIKKELEELKAFILSSRKNNAEFKDYYKVYCRYETLSVLYSYLKADTQQLDNESNKTR